MHLILVNFSKFYSGICVQEVQITFSSWATLIIRLYNTNELESEWIIGPIPDDFGLQGREVVIRYTLNGKQMSINNKGNLA